jgi:predicted nucleic acid-binding protein
MTAGGRKPCLVVDACVVLKWQLDDEGDTAAALAIRHDYLTDEIVELSAPSLLVYELANGVHSATRRMRLKPEVAREALANLLACEIRLETPEPERMLQLAQEYQITPYDAAYVQAAERLGAPLWTADRALYNAVHGKLPWVQWISDYTR